MRSRPGEINVGNVGPSLTGYGLQRGNSEAIAKLTYETHLQRVGVTFPAPTCRASARPAT